MSQIELHGISKTFSVAKRPEGRFGMFRGAFQRETQNIDSIIASMYKEMRL
jgi:hypothetical protein